MKPKNHHQKGFTIVELLIAMGIFAMLAGISYTAINASINAQKIEATHSKELAKLQKTLHYINRDFGQIFEQRIYLHNSKLEITVLQNLERKKIEYSFKGDKFIRQDVTDEDKVFSKVERKRRRKEEREQGQSNDRSQESPELVLMEEVKGRGKIWILNKEKEWKDDSRGFKDIKALKIEFEHKKFGVIKKLVLLNE